jgi:hypothetical protein
MRKATRMGRLLFLVPAATRDKRKRTRWVLRQSGFANADQRNEADFQSFTRAQRSTEAPRVWTACHDTDIDEPHHGTRMCVCWATKA